MNTKNNILLFEFNIKKENLKYLYRLEQDKYTYTFFFA